MSPLVFLAYQTAINKIDDFIEYRMRFPKDKEEISMILSDLTKEIKRVSKNRKGLNGYESK